MLEQWKSPGVCNVTPVLLPQETGFRPVKNKSEAVPFGGWTHQGFGVAEDVVLEELVQHVEAVVLDQRLDHQLVQVVLRETPRLNIHTRRAAAGHTGVRQEGEVPAP